jgi:lipoyl(octanoyl) transferase
LSHFAGIVPCGVADARFGVTSLTDLGHLASMPEVDMVLRREFEGLFGATEVAEPLVPAKAGTQSQKIPAAAGSTGFPLSRE